MTDLYSCFAELAATELSDHFAISIHDTHSSTVLAAAHGGGIEPGSSEIARAIAGNDLSYGLFEGRLSSGNERLHITSSRFDEAQCRQLWRAAEVVVDIHGEASAEERVYIGGLHTALREACATALAAAGYRTGGSREEDFRALSPDNICNCGRTGTGLQLEISQGLRRTFFEGLTRRGRMKPKDELFRFCAVIRGVLDLNTIQKRVSHPLEPPRKMG